MRFIRASRGLILINFRMLVRKPGQYGPLLLIAFMLSRAGLKLQGNSNDSFFVTAFYAGLFGMCAISAATLSCNILTERGLLDMLRDREAWREYLVCWIATYLLVMSISLAPPVGIVVFNNCPDVRVTGPITAYLLLFMIGVAITAALCIRVLAPVSSPFLADKINTAAIMTYASATLLGLWFFWDTDTFSLRPPGLLVVAVPAALSAVAFLRATKPSDQSAIALSGLSFPEV